MKKLAILVFIIIACLFVYFFLFLNKKSLNQNQATVSINNKKYYVEIADTDEKRTQGLSVRTLLPQNHGMLFIFPQKNKYGFWMKDMNFPLDIIWIDSDTIVDISENVPPPSSPTDQLKIYQPKIVIDKVLELNEGEVAKNNIEIGQKIELK